jgi:hypothetical protein
MLNYPAIPGEERRSRVVEGYYLEAPAYVFPEASDSYDEEDDFHPRKLPGSLQRHLKMTLKDFYANLGDLTALKRHQPGINPTETLRPETLEETLGPSTSRYELTGTDSDSAEESGITPHPPP